MNYAIILASGNGTRVKDGISLPKQFRDIGGIPIFIQTISAFEDSQKFDYIYLVAHEKYINYAEDKIKTYFKKEKNIKIICGGVERMDSIENAIEAIKANTNQKINSDDIVVIHDAVRPFVTQKIINDSIEGAKKYGAVVCAVPVSDTLLISDDGNVVNSIPNRGAYFKGQSPDSFNLSLFIELLSKLSPENRARITGTSQVCTMNNYPIHMIEGDELNFKITTKSDILIAESIIKEKK